MFICTKGKHIYNTCIRVSEHSKVSKSFVCTDVQCPNSKASKLIRIMISAPILLSGLRTKFGPTQRTATCGSSNSLVCDPRLLLQFAFGLSTMRWQLKPCQLLDLLTKGKLDVKFRTLVFQTCFSISRKIE